MPENRPPTMHTAACRDQDCTGCHPLLSFTLGPELAPFDADRTSLDDLATEARTVRRDTPHPALCGARCCATPADYADLRDL